MPLAVRRNRGPFGLDLGGTEGKAGGAASADAVLGDPFALNEDEDFLPGPAGKPGDFGGVVISVGVEGGGGDGGGLTAVKGGGGRGGGRGVRVGRSSSHSEAQLF